MKKDIRIFAIPTKNASNVGRCIKALSDVNIGDWGHFNSSMFMSLEYFQPFELYTTTDETIKEGDYGFWEDANIISFISDLKATTKETRKVVATTDRNLILCTDSNHDAGIVCTCNKLASMSPEFQQAWVKSMNENVPIVDALMEYEYGIINEGNPTCADLDSEKPKLNPQGYVTILPKVSKVYSREEVIDMLWGIRTFYHQHSNLSFNKIRPLFKELINRNL